MDFQKEKQNVFENENGKFQNHKDLGRGLIP